jgi:tRNA pseudouridine38-40 synthase
MRFAIGLEYDGSAFLGWQIQKHGPSVQGSVEQAFGAVANHPVHVTCCGRTDTGVHARCQVAHFDSTAKRTERSWILGANSHLPREIAVLWLRPVADEFHARFSAFSRSYRYRILNRWVRPALEASRSCWFRSPLDEQAMHRAAQCMLGEHDFTSFRAASCQARHAVREIQQLTVTRSGPEICIDITANGFLYHMVRNIAGSLMAIGSGEQPVEWMEQLLLECDRTRAAPTAAAEGLCFMGARYPLAFDLPGADAAFPVAEHRA